MERHEIETFLTLAEELHFRRTSERLGVAQGRVSQTIKKLERRIGAPLFVRTSRHVALTDIGRRLRDDLLPGHLQIQRAIADARAAARALTEILRVGFSAPWSAALVIQAADILRARHPQCQVRITEVQLTDPFGPLRAGQLDLQLSEWPVHEPDLTCGPVVLTEPRALIVPAGHPLAGRTSISLEDLAEVELITIGGDVPGYWLEAHYPSVTPSGRPVAHGQSVTYWQEVVPLIAAGKGVSTASLRVAEHYSHPGLVVVPYHDAPPIEYGLVWPTTRQTAMVQAFAQALEAIEVRQPEATGGYGGAGLA
ncbi:LysR family transcriptional regulator [Nonomuraea sp. NBC_01738]|uniref:LysR family transcriptional regulator n=1 Tax=Nonomuraea sp. NBC_01738 TaxID=2976003 RepID=UPI002E0F5652|nr:LysR family transcriptional regulator [Nonomuraea sp. NBC_01738]